MLLGNSWDCVSIGEEQMVFATLSSMDFSTLATCAVSGRGVVGAVRGAVVSIVLALGAQEWIWGQKRRRHRG